MDFVSPDLVRDPQTGARYYNMRIALQQEGVRRLADLQLVPGMPAEIFIRTRERTPLQYLLKPLNEQIARAFRER